MNKKRVKILIICISLAVALLGSVAAVLFMSRPLIKFDCPDTLEVFSSQDELAPKAYFSVFDIRLPLEAGVQGKIETDKLGSYPVTYTASFLGITTEKTCDLEIIDTVPPVIEPSDYNYTYNSVYGVLTPDKINITYTATDNYDGNITANVKKEISGNVCVLSVSDSSGNSASAEINIIYLDKTKPTINLVGGNTIYHLAGNKYNDFGYTATDDIDGDMTASVAVSGKIDDNKSGVYPVEYTVTDSSGNTAKVIRKVIVYGTMTAADFRQITPNGKTVYLTFDDGPGPYTERLLGYLDQYGVKATFFVTNQFPKYQNLIGETHRRGHKIALHSFTHNWSIYTSVDSFMADFEAMQNLIAAQTGSRTEIFRFPGGTNNTVSRRYRRGIMSELSGKLLSEGYAYFDWNCDCNDARTTYSGAVIWDTIQQISRKNNAVVLMHDIKDYTVDAVPAILEHCLKEGYTFKVLEKDSPIVRFRPVN